MAEFRYSSLSMDLLVILVVAATVLFFLGANLHGNRHGGQLRSVLMAQTWAVGLFIAMKLAEAWVVREGMDPDGGAVLRTLADLSGALAATFGLAVAHYLVSGGWRRHFYILVLPALLPDYGHFFAAALWLLIPLRVRAARRAARDETGRIKMETILTGCYAGGLWMLLLSPVHALGLAPMAIEPLGALLSLLFLYAGLNARHDPENEFSFPATASLVKCGLMVILPASIIAPLSLDLQNFHILQHFLIPALILMSCAFLFILTLHFDSLGIRTFLVLFLIALLPAAFSQLYMERLAPWTITGMRLFSRIALVLASLFILKEYLRWGFEIVQNMVMIITALTSASIVFVIIAFVQPHFMDQANDEYELVHSAILLLDVVVLAALPPVLVNYHYGTMKVTWAILTAGLFFEVYQDFLPATAERFEANIVGVLAYALIALAFVTLWRFSVAMMRQIQATAEDDLS